VSSSDLLLSVPPALAQASAKQARAQLESRMAGCAGLAGALAIGGDFTKGFE
jgi:hypothetical protein